MRTQSEIREILEKLRKSLESVFPQEQMETILFGSYARGDAAAEMLMEYGIVVSPIVESRAYYHTNANILPFFKSITKEGVRIGA